MGAAIEQEHHIGFFDELVCRGAGTVKLMDGPEPHLVVVGEPDFVSRVVVRYRGSRLVVAFRVGPNPAAIFGGGARVTTIVITDDVSRVAIQGAADLELGDGEENPFCAESLRLVSSGTGSVHGHVSANELSIRIRGIGGAAVAGDTVKLDARLAGIGSLEAMDLVARSARVVVSGTGSCRIMALDTLVAVMNGAGALTYRGSASLIRKGAGTGRVNHLD